MNQAGPGRLICARRVVLLRCPFPSSRDVFTTRTCNSLVHKDTPLCRRTALRAVLFMETTQAPDANCQIPTNRQFRYSRETRLRGHSSQVTFKHSFTRPGFNH